MAKCNKCGKEIDETKGFLVDLLNSNQETNKEHKEGECSND